MVVALDHVLKPKLQIVTQIVKAKLIVGAIGHITAIGLPAGIIINPPDNAANTQPQKFIDLPHPARVARGEIVVDRHDVDALARQRVQEHGKGRHQRLALSRLHFCDLALVKRHSSHQLDIKMPLTKRSFCRLTHQSKGFGHKRIKALTLCHTFFECCCCGRKILVTQQHHPVLKLVYRRDHRSELFNYPVVGVAKQAFRQ